MTDKFDVINGLKHHRFIIDEDRRRCEYCTYNRYEDDCETILTRDALMYIEAKQERYVIGTGELLEDR